MKAILQNTTLVLICCLLSIFTAHAASVPEPDVVKLWLVKDHQIYKAFKSSREYQFMREGSKVFLLTGDKKTFLGTVDRTERFDKPAPDILIADLMFDGNPKFLIKNYQSNSILGSSYKVVDDKGDDIFDKLFDATARGKMDEIVDKELPTPVFHYSRKSLSCTKIFSLYKNTRYFLFSSGRYIAKDSEDSVHFDKSDIYILKNTTYKDSNPEIFLSCGKINEDNGRLEIRNVYVNIIAKSELSVTASPQSKDILYTMNKNDTGTILDFFRIHTPEGEKIWLKVALGKNNVSGWVEKSDAFAVVPQAHPDNVKIF